MAKASTRAELADAIVSILLEESPAWDCHRALGATESKQVVKRALPTYHQAQHAPRKLHDPEYEWIYQQRGRKGEDVRDEVLVRFGVAISISTVYRVWREYKAGFTSVL